MEKKDVVFMCYNVGNPVGPFFKQYINAKDIIEIIPTKIGSERDLMIIYYDRELRSKCSLFCDGIAIKSNKRN